MMNLQKWMKTLMIGGALVSMVGTVSAHVTVWPQQSTTGAYEKYTVRVPVEKNTNTIKVRLAFPPGEKVSTVEPAAGWSYSFEKDSNGNNTALDWTATAGGIKPGEFTEFSFIGVNPKTPGKIAWKAYQTYADGTVVEWTGAPTDATPASVTTITAAPAPGTQTQPINLPSQQTQLAAGTQPAAQTQPATSGGSNTLPLVLSGVAVLLSLISLFRKRA